MTTALRDVRSQGQSGKHILALSFSDFDPTETSSLTASEARRRLVPRWPNCNALGFNAAKALGLIVPPTLLTAADKVIE